MQASAGVETTLAKTTQFHDHSMSNPDAITQWRRAQRNELLARRMAVPLQQRRRWDARITRQLLDGFPQLRNPVVGFYWPFKAEFDPRFAIRALRQLGARAALPVVLQRDAPLQFREWWPGVATRRSVFDLPVPVGTELLRPDVLLIPPVGFDGMGYRLGYGGGYFDRTLAALAPSPIKIGVGYELSRMPTIRPQPHDIAMDFIVTEQAIYRVQPGGLQCVDPLRQD